MSLVTFTAVMADTKKRSRWTGLVEVGEDLDLVKIGADLRGASIYALVTGRVIGYGRNRRCKVLMCFFKPVDVVLFESLLHWRVSEIQSLRSTKEELEYNGKLVRENRELGG